MIHIDLYYSIGDLKKCRTPQGTRNTFTCLIGNYKAQKCCSPSEIHSKSDLNVTSIVISSIAFIALGMQKNLKRIETVSFLLLVSSPPSIGLVIVYFMMMLEM